MHKNRVGNGWPTALQELLLKACLFSGSLAQDAWTKWTSSVHLQEIDSASYKLLPLVACNRDLTHIQEPIFKHCKALHRKTWITNRIHFEKTVPFLLELQRHVDKIVLLKGIAMIIQYYRDFGARVIGDLDLLIPRASAPIAASILHASQWVCQVSRLNIGASEQLDRWHALNFVHQGGMNLDLHWSLSLESSPFLDEAVLQASVPHPIHQHTFYLPAPSDLLLQTCVHGIKPCQEPLIRWVADAMTLLKHAEKEIDWDRFLYLARASHLCISLFAALEYLHKSFSAPIPIGVLNQLKETKTTSLEMREYQANSKGHKRLAGWYRFCLRYGYQTRKNQLLHLFQYLQCSALLKSFWHLPFYSLSWIFKRSIRYLYSFQLNRLWTKTNSKLKN